MTFYITFSGNKKPGKEHYVIVTAACEATAIEKVMRRGWRNWSVISTSRVVTRKLTLWGEI